MIVGMDICEDVIQLAYFDQKLLKPTSVKKGEDQEDYLIPTRLALKVKKHEWIIGDEIDAEEGEEVIEIPDFLSLVITGRETEILGETYTAGHLMQIFIRRVLFVLNTYYPYRELEFLAFTFEKISKTTVSVMQEAMSRLEMKGKYALLDHDEAFLYHTIHRSKENRINDTALFELEKDRLRFSVLHIDENSTPVVAKISERYVTADLSGEMVRKAPDEALKIFENLAFMALENRVISNVYAVGRGFFTSWADEALRKLSPGRHVFRGQNLFVLGACHLARDRAIGREENLIFLGADRIAAGVSIMAIKDGREREIVLASPSLKWYEADLTTDVIIKGEDELCIRIKDFISKKITQRFLSLSGINLTGNDLSRLRLSVKFKDKDTCIIKAVDLGFGSFVPTTNRVWELTWEK